MSMPNGAMQGSGLNMGLQSQSYGGWSSGASFGNNLPRAWIDFLSGSFGPMSPFNPIGIDTPDQQTGRAEPRRMQYPIAWNMPVGVPGSEGLKLVSFANLRSYADMYSVVRACIQVRKEEIMGLEWDIVPTDAAQRDMREDQGAHEDFQQRRLEVLDFFKRPDPNYHDFAGWLGALLEDVFVVDACSLYIHPTRKKGKGLLGSDLGALEVLDGTTIRPLLDIRGGVPRPPNAAYQQYLWGVPRTDMMDIILQSDIEEMDEPVAQFRADQLLYLPYTRRTWTPYGFSPLEMSIIPVMMGLRRQQFQLEYFSEGSIPGQFVIPGEDISTPQQIRQLQDTLNALAGDQAWKHKIIVLPRGSDAKPQKPTPLADQFDEIVMSMVCMAFDVMPMELGISPKVSTTQSPGASNQMAKASAEINERKALKPMLGWLKTAIFDHVLQDICDQQDMQWMWTGMEQGDDEESQANNFKTMISVGLMSIDEARVGLGLSPWGLPLTSDPIYMSPTGVSTLGVIAPQIADAALGEPTISPDQAALQPGVAQPVALPTAPQAQPGTPATAVGTPGIGGRPVGGGGGAPSVTPPAAGTSTPLHGTPGKAAVKAATDELEALRRYLKKGRKLEDWEPEFMPAAAMDAVHKAIARGADSAAAVAAGKKALKGASRLGRRETVTTGAATSVGAALGHLAGQINSPTSGPIQFIDQGTSVLQQGYQNVYEAGAQDAASDLSNVSPVVPGGFAALAAQRAATQRPFLTGMAQDLVAGVSPAALAQRLALYARSLQPAYEEGYGLAVTSGQALGNEDYGDDEDEGGDLDGTDTSTDGSGGVGALATLLGVGVGSLLAGTQDADGSSPDDGDATGFDAPPRSQIIWHTTSDDPCELCADRDGEEYTLDSLPGWPGDGGFGDLCEGAGNCNCYLEYLDADGSTTAGNPLSAVTNDFYQQREAEEAQHDADAVAARAADIDAVAQTSPDAAQRMRDNDAMYGVSGTRYGPGGRYDIAAGVEAELQKGTSKTIRQLVDFQFDGQYPPATTDWVKDAKWSYEPAVPLSKIDMARRPGGRNMATVTADAARFKAGHKPSPMVLVDQGDGTYDIADGYHRSLGLQKAGITTAPAFIADMGKDPQPDLTIMQTSKLYKTVTKALPAEILAEAEVGDRVVDDETGTTYIIKMLGDDEAELEEI